MAIEYYSSIDLNQNELQFPVIHKLGSAPTSPAAVAGQLYYDSGSNTLNVYNGSAWINVGGDITGVTAGTGLNGGGTTGAVTLNVDAAQTAITSIVNTSLVIGRDADNDIDFATDNQIIFRVGGGDNVIFKASGEIEATSLDISGDADIDGTLEADAITVNGTALNTVIAGVTVANATLAATVTVTDSTANTGFPVVFNDESNALLDDTGAFTYNPSSGLLTVPNLTVSGTTTTVNTTNLTIEDNNMVLSSGNSTSAVINGAGLTLEGGSGDDATFTYSTSGPQFEMKLGSSYEDLQIAKLTASSLDISGDADIDGTLETDALSINGTTVSSTATELNLLDAGTAGSSVTLATNDTIIIGDTSASNATKKVLMSDVLALMGSNLTEVGALDAGSITSGFGAIDNGTSGIRTATFTVETSIVPAAANSATIGTASAEFGDFFLGDGGTIQFGDDQDIIITHEADKGLKISNENTGAAKPMILTLESEEDAIVSDDIIAGIEFKAGDSDGTDGATVAAGIFAVAADTFGASSNRTSLVFTTGSSETAGQTSGSLDGVTKDMVLDLFGKLTLQDDIVIGDGKTIGGSADTDLMTLGNGVLTIAGELDASSLDISGDADIDGTLETDALTIGGTSVLAVATDSAQGAVELATSAEVQTGTDTSRVVTPDTLAAKSVVADIVVSSLTDANIVTITHNLGTADIMVQVYDKTTEANIMCDIARTTDDFSTASTSVVSIDFGTAPPNDCRALITSLAGATAGSIAYT
jgi:cytoskeletal protein CcmA (bactofilin family)